MKKIVLLGMIAIIFMSQVAFAVMQTPPAAKIAAGTDHNIAIMSDGTLWAWGAWGANGEGPVG